LKYELLTDEKTGFSGLVPEVGTEGSSCIDIYVPISFEVEPYSWVTVPLLIAFEIPEHLTLLLIPRSSTFTKHGLLCPVSVIDSDYRSGIHGLLYNCTRGYKHFERGMRLFQLLKVQHEPWDILEQVPTIEKLGRGGLGSTGL
jgi:deoxyuridine 5'-triphosphate nucleotidohydrolase